jgi:hypothetical protein
MTTMVLHAYALLRLLTDGWQETCEFLPVLAFGFSGHESVS